MELPNKRWTCHVCVGACVSVAQMHFYLFISKAFLVNTNHSHFTPHTSRRFSVNKKKSNLKLLSIREHQCEDVTIDCLRGSTGCVSIWQLISEHFSNYVQFRSLPAEVKSNYSNRKCRAAASLNMFYSLALSLSLPSPPPPPLVREHFSSRSAISRQLFGDNHVNSGITSFP